MPGKRMPYTKMFKESTRPVKMLYPTLAYTSRLNPKAKSFTPKKPKRILDIRNVTQMLKPGIRGMNIFAKPFSPKKSSGKKHRKSKSKKRKTHKKRKSLKKSRRSR
jgi:hypothetical protein